MAKTNPRSSCQVGDVAVGKECQRYDSLVPFVLVSYCSHSHPSGIATVLGRAGEADSALWETYFHMLWCSRKQQCQELSVF